MSKRKETVGEYSRGRARTSLRSSLTYIQGYPRKLTLYKIPASPFWQVRYFIDGKVIRRSTREERKSAAIEKAKLFFEEVTSRNRFVANTTTRPDVTFAHCSKMVLRDMKGQLDRGDITQDTYDIVTLRLNKAILPLLGSQPVADIQYEHIDNLVNHLSEHKSINSSVTIRAYLQIVAKILDYAQKAGLIEIRPAMPKVKAKSKPRGYFTHEEYQKLLAASKKMIGQRYSYLVDDSKPRVSGQARGVWVLSDSGGGGRRVTTISITKELYCCIGFMVNSFIRPHDLRSIQNRHVAIHKGEHSVLLLSHPPTKGHHETMVSMPEAIGFHQELLKHNKANNLPVKANDYLFLPHISNRKRALKILATQFRILLSQSGLAMSSLGESRCLYSLRHSSIMFRLLFGASIDLVSLARNARTSVEIIDHFYASHLEPTQNIERLIANR